MISEQKLKYHREYFKQYYGSEFKYGQGTEVILDVLNRYGRGGKWLDLSGGTNTFFWSIALNNISDVTVMDIDEEAGIVLNEIREQRFANGCYEFALRKYKKEPEDIYSIPISFVKADILSDNIEKYTLQKFDIITQFGLWGLLKDENVYLQKIKDAEKRLKHDGILISANWTFEGELIKKRGYDNGYLQKSLIEEFCEREGFDLLFLDEIKIQNDSEYSKVLIYVLR